MICPNYMKDAMGLWACGAPGRICTKRYDTSIVCDIKPCHNNTPPAGSQPCIGFVNIKAVKGGA